MKASTKAWFFLGTFSILLIALGQWFYEQEGLLWASSMALSINGIIYFLDYPKLFKKFKLRHLEGQDPWQLLDLVSKVSRQAHTPEPQVYIIEHDSPQALVLGGRLRSGYILITHGTLKELNKKELRAVIAYLVTSLQMEVPLIYSIASYFCGAILKLSHSLDALARLVIGLKKEPLSLKSYFFTYLFSPLAFIIYSLTIQSDTYLQVDKQALELIEEPEHLAQALWKLDSFAKTEPFLVPAEMSHMFIVNPLTPDGWYRYFQAQPSIAHRIKNIVGYYPL